MAPAPADAPPASAAADEQERQVIEILRRPDADDILREVISTLSKSMLGGDDDERMERSREVQRRLERRCSLLTRRLGLGVARAVGARASDECRCALGGAQGARRLVRRLERCAALPRSPLGVAPAKETQPTARRLRERLDAVQRRLDSDATDESSGAESNDETVPYNNPHQRKMPPTQRALWKWAHERASIASKWTWLQAQIQELEYKIRQHTELQRRVRAAKGTSNMFCEPSGYTGRLPGETVHSDNNDEDEVCIRAKPLNRTTFRKRKLLQMHNLHTATEKAAKPSNIRCICQWPLGSCAVCTGRVLPMHPLPYTSTLTKKERLALVDPAYHPVLSTNKEISTSVQYSAKMKIPNWQQKSHTLKALKGNVPMIKPQQTPSKLMMIPSKSHSKKKKHKESKKSKSSMGLFDRNTQIKRRLSIHDAIKREIVEGGSPQAQPFPSGSSSPVPSPSDQRHRPRERMERSRLNSSYDIDNIVIPHSIAASTKLEILQYKEILTPKWRIVEPEEIQSPNNGIIRKLSQSHDYKEEEDVSEPTVMMRHGKCEELEKGKYLQKRKSSRRQNSRSGTGSNPPLTPSETPPHTPATMVDETSTHSESAITNITSVSSSLIINTVTTSSTIINTSATMTSSILSSATSEPSTINTIQTHSTATISNKRRLTLPPEEIEIIPPYSPRIFPLSDDAYNNMLLAMPDNHPLSTDADATDKHHSLGSCNNGSDSESNSGPVYCHQVDSLVEGSDAIMGQPSDSDNDSCSVPLEEDPNDPEWNVSVHAD